MVIRNYEPADCTCLTELFYNTVHTVNRIEYTQEQVNVWATGSVDEEEWNRSFSEHITIVAVADTVIVGFGDIDQTGYLDRVYVHKDYQRKGIAAAICDALESAVDVPVILTHASITAKPFFEKRGYRMIREQQVERQGVFLTNYIMENTRCPVTKTMP